MDVVRKALSKVQEGNGYDYLAKVVQIPFNVPSASIFEIHKLLCINLNEIIKDYPEDQFDQRYWQNIFQSGLKQFFYSIRNVNRFINIFRFKYFLLKQEVNIIDLISISVIEVFMPDMYLKIRDNKNLFVQTQIDYSHRVDQGGTLKKEIDEMIEENAPSYLIDETKSILTELFPKLKSVYDGPLFGESYSTKWRKEGRICSEDNFNTFFQLSIPAGRISKSELERIMGKSNKLDSFNKELDRLIEESKVTEFLERMEDYSDSVPKDNVQTIISSLMDKGDSFREDNETFLGFDNNMRVMRITYQLLKRFDSQNNRFQILKNAIENAENSLHTIEHEVAIQGQEHGKRTSKDETEPEGNRLIERSQLEKLEEIACDKIRKWAKDGRLLKHKNLFAILYSWEFWGGEEEVKKFITDSIANNKGLVEFVAKTPHRIKSQGMGDYGYRTENRINIKNVEHFVKLDEIVPKLRSIKQSDKFNDLKDTEQKAIDIFLDTIDGKVKDL